MTPERIQLFAIGFVLAVKHDTIVQFERLERFLRAHGEVAIEIFLERLRHFAKQAVGVFPELGKIELEPREPGLHGVFHVRSHGLLATFG